MMQNWKIRLVVPAFAFAACMILGTTQVAKATDICGGPGFYACKDAGPNGVCQQGEQCDDGNTVDGDGCDTNCMQTACGNGVTTAGEECDGGSDTSVVGHNDDLSPTASPVAGGPCDTSCRLKECSNGRVEGGESCDDGNTFNNDGCDSDPNTVFSDTSHPGLCNGSGCGNGITNMNEMPTGCDDGNTVSGDGCSAACVSEFCGDGVSNNAPTETCDDGNTVQTDYCNNVAPTAPIPANANNCNVHSCGDGTTQTSVEQCDDANTVNTDACRNACTTSRCGDGISDIGETCDDGNTINDDTCLGACQGVPVCGDGTTDPNEECDVGACTCVAPKHASNTKSCATEAGRTACHADGGTCFNADTGLSCDCGAPATCDPADGNYNDVPNACHDTCDSASCGDGVTDQGEGCDDGFVGTAPSPADDNDSCPNGSGMFAMGMECQMINSCGDGVPNADAPNGNICDDGQFTSPKTCSNNDTLCSVNTDCGAGNTCGNADGAGGTCHGIGFADAECPNGAALDACACHPHYCGDGATDVGEGCDDGNTVSNDDADGTGPIGGCQSNCALASCGDGITGPGEACDAGAQNGMVNNHNPGADCTKVCNLNTCGDGEALDTEGCDDGNNVNTDDCLNTCAGAACGDTVTQTTGSPILEQCDDGNTVDAEGATGTTDGCSGHCCWEPTVALPTIAGQLAAQQCNLDHLAAEIAALTDSRLKKRLSRHMATALKLSSQASAALAAGSNRKLCSAEKRKDRVTICIERALALALLKGQIDKATYIGISQKTLNVHGWVQMIRMNSGCFF